MFVTSARQICFHGHFTVCFVLNSKQRPMLSQSFVPCLLSAQEKSSQACWHGTPPPLDLDHNRSHVSCCLVFLDGKSICGLRLAHCSVIYFLAVFSFCYMIGVFELELPSSTALPSKRPPPPTMLSGEPPPCIRDMSSSHDLSLTTQPSC